MQVRALDLEGNVDPTPASYTWTVGAPPDCDAANITLVATGDATVDEGSVVENFGGAENLTVRSQAPGADARTLVRFALPEGGTGCSIQSATLRLHGEGDAGPHAGGRPGDGWLVRGPGHLEHAAADRRHPGDDRARVPATASGTSPRRSRRCSRAGPTRAG